jgi:hypothetical protein
MRKEAMNKAALAKSAKYWRSEATGARVRRSCGNVGRILAIRNSSPTHRAALRLLPAVV